MSTPGDAYDAVLIGALRTDVFDLEDVDAVAAVKDAGKQAPPFGKPAQQPAEEVERP